MNNVFILNRNLEKSTGGIQCAVKSLKNLLYNIQGISVVEINSVFQAPSSGIIIVTKLFVAFHLLIKNLFSRKIKVIALLSDCYFYALIRDFQLGLRYRYFSISNIIKSPFIFCVELFIILTSRYIIVQTEKDKEIFKRVYFGINKFIVIPNIINNKEISERICKKGKLKTVKIGWVATFKGSYLKIAMSIFKHDLINLFKNRNNIEIQIFLLGPGNKEFYYLILKKHPELSNVIFIKDYYENIEEFYNECELTIAPIFKNYGLINKVVESMFFGCIVIGDVSAFNGLKINNLYNSCIVKKNESFTQKVNQIIELIKEEKNMKEIIKFGKEIINSSLNYESNLKKMKYVLKEIL